MGVAVDPVILPPGIVGQAARMTALRLAGPEGEAVLAAGPLPRRAGKDGALLPERLAVSVVRAGWVAQLWATARGSAAVGRADLVCAGPDDARALLLLPRRALVALDPFATEPRAGARLVARGWSVPGRLFTPGGQPVGVTVRAGGETILDRFGPDGTRIAGGQSPGPRLAPGQVVSQLLRDGEGRLVLTADDPARGFQVWREEAGGWRHLVSDGAARFGQNAAVLHGTLWQGLVVLAVGITEEMREKLVGMPIRGEIVTLDGAGRVGLIAGELRTSSAGLLVPRIGAPAMRNMAAEAFLRVAAGPEGVLVAAVGRTGGVALCRIAGGGTPGEVLGTLPGLPLEMTFGPRGDVRALVAAAADDPEDADGDDDGGDLLLDDSDWAAFADALDERA
jgi:hypothetical protein